MSFDKEIIAKYLPDRPARPKPGQAGPFHETPEAALLARASAAVARLNEAVRSAPSPLRAGWTARALLQEAAVSARLDEIFIEAPDLLLMDHDALGRLVDQDMQRAYQGLQLLRAVDRRHPRQLFTPRRLAATARLRLRERKDVEGYPEWLEARRSDPSEIRQALEKSMDPAALAMWRGRAPLVGAAGFLGLWHGSGAADLVGGTAGRALAGAWLRREAPELPPTFFPSIGFLGHAAEYRPDTTARWIVAFLEASLRSAEAGMGLLSSLRRVEERLREGAAAQRSTSRLPELIDLLVSIPAISSRRAAEILEVTPVSARRLLDRLKAQSLVQEITGRDSFRLYALF